MKKKFKNILLLTFFALFTITSCQDEITDITEPDEELVIVPESPLATMMRSTSTNDGSVDNIMDDANCMSINLPVTIIVNTITITINTLEDLELIVDIFEEFTDDDDDIEFIFPLTIILNDHTEVVIADSDELESFIERCENIEDHNNCIGFKYPISFSIFNSEFQLINTVVIENDRGLYHFLDRIEDVEEAILASLNFPVEMIFANGDIVEVNDNQELARVMNEAEGMCDDDDQYDDCDIEEVNDYLLDCHWNIHHYNGENNYRPYNITFLENGELTIINEQATVAITGHWTTTETDAGVVLSITELTQFGEILGGEWLIVECDDDRFKLVKAVAGAENTRMLIKRHCGDEPDCGPQEIRMNLVECHWYAGANINDNNQLGQFYFGYDGTLVVVDETNNVEVTGTWEVALTDYGIKLILDLPEPYAMLSRYWKVIECDDNRIKVMHEDHYIVFERECYNPFECFENTELVICDDDVIDGLTEIDLELVYLDCPQDDVEISYHISLEDAENGANTLPSMYSNITNPQIIYGRIEIAGSTANYEIFEVELYVEDCSEGCTEEDVDSYLMEAECHWVPVVINGSDDFNTYDFYFNDNQDLKIVDGDGAETLATWTTSGTTNDGVMLSISQIDGTLQQFNGNWAVVECGAERMVLVSNNIELVLERECQ